jgi:RNase H-like domain found in reverse transcriptase
MSKGPEEYLPQYWFIEGYGKIVKPLTELTGKLDWKWKSAQTEAFDEIKCWMCNTPVLSLPNNNGKFQVEADSSDFATGAILSQEQLDGKWKPVAFSLHVLNPTERNYEIYDKEMLAIIRALSE